MRPETRLDSATFQLTPTRTRCDLVIIANGEKEKVASGLLNPFLAHLKAAHDQIERGGYSIVLEPNPEDKHTASWFTKGTVERFVRFVSTPEVLERVNTIECEIVQIDEAITIQGSTNVGLNTVDDHQTKPVESNEGSRSVSDAEADKAIILYKPDNQQNESHGSATQENSKVNLLRVLESRKTVLQKEQGMAFARAVAAGFDMDHMDDLISFADCFGAARLREACQTFVELWKRKHETAQWLEAMEMQATEGISGQPELRIPWPVAHGDVCLENGLKTRTEPTNNFEHMVGPSGDKRSPADEQVPLCQNNYFQGQVQHPMYMQMMQWPPQGAPIFPAYPLPGMPYYPNYPGSGPFFQQPYAQVENPNFSSSERILHKRNPMDGKDVDVDSESYTEIDKEEAHSHESRRKGDRGGKKRTGMVVIRNINYITSNRKNDADGESQSGSASETEEEVDEVPSSSQKRKHKGSARASKEDVKHLQPVDDFGSHERDSSKGTEVENGHWQAFQNFLLSKDDDDADKDMFPLHNTAHVRRQETASDVDSLPLDRSLGTSANQRMTEHDIINLNVTKKGTNDDSTNGFPYNRELSDQQDLQFSETERGFRGVKRMGDDDFMMYGHQNQTSAGGPISDPVAGSEFERAGSAGKSSLLEPRDESFIVPVRSSSHTSPNGGIDIGMDSEFSLNTKTIGDSNKQRPGHVISYEPDDLSMMPERGTESSYDVAVDYEIQVQADMSFSANGVKLPQKVKDEDKSVDKQEKKTVDKDKKSKLTRDGMEKRKVDAVRNAKLTKSSPLVEAQARAERVRAYKADLQKAKREQEDEKIKKLEALKREREKRITARSSSMRSPLSSQQTKPQLSTKLSLSLLKSSKFSDSETASPTTKIGRRSGSVGSLSSLKILKSDTSSGACVVQNGLTRSASSLQNHKKESSGVANAPETRLRRLSEPRNFNSHLSDQKQTPKQRETETQGTKISPVTKTNRKNASAHANQRLSARSSPGPVQNKVKIRETTSGASESHASWGSGIGQKKISDNNLNQGETSDTVVIDKNVLTIEHGMPVVPTVQASEERKELRRGLHNDDTAEEKTKVVSEYATIQDPPSVLMDDNGPKEQAKQVAVDCAVEEITSNFHKATFNEQPYHAPHAQKSSLEDPCASISEYSKALPLISESLVPVESSKAHVPECSSSIPSKHILDGSEKPPEKESKGFKRLLKFGRKNNGSSSSEKEKDHQKVDFAALNADSGYEVHSLKNLISQDDSHSEVDPNQKARSFSLLSPFRSKKQS